MPFVNKTTRKRSIGVCAADLFQYIECTEEEADKFEAGAPFPVADITPDVRRAYTEAAYRRGVNQALHLALQLNDGERSLAAMISTDMRFDGEPHPTYTDEIRRRVKAATEALSKPKH